MILTDHEGQVLTPEDLAFLRAHPRIERLVVKACKMQGQPPEIQTLTLLAWAGALFAANYPARTPQLIPNFIPERPLNSMNFDLLGQLLGKNRRRQLEAQARQTAQRLLDAGKERLVSAALQALNTLPDESAASELHLIAGALLTQTLASAPVQRLVPAAARPALTAAIGQVLAGVPVPDPAHADPLGAFQIAAKIAVASAIRGLTL